jgi:putative ATPase
LHKAVRGSDPDAALYWFAGCWKGARTRASWRAGSRGMAVEDIGLADPQAQGLCLRHGTPTSGWGRPRASSRWRRRSCTSRSRPSRTRSTRPTRRRGTRPRRTGSLAPPAHILNAPTRLMKERGFGAGYQYDPRTAEDGFSGQESFPRGDEAGPSTTSPWTGGSSGSCGSAMDFFAGLAPSGGRTDQRPRVLTLAACGPRSPR